jgi:hypothetical protein
MIFQRRTHPYTLFSCVQYTVTFPITNQIITRAQPDEVETYTHGTSLGNVSVLLCCCAHHHACIPCKHTRTHKHTHTQTHTHTHTHTNISVHLHKAQVKTVPQLSIPWGKNTSAKRLPCIIPHKFCSADLYSAKFSFSYLRHKHAEQQVTLNTPETERKHCV